MIDNNPELENLTPEELECYKILKWCDENPDKIIWVDGSHILDYAIK